MRIRGRLSMDDKIQIEGSSRLTRQMKITYWIALALIASMATASYWLLDRRLSEHRYDRELLTTVAGQGTLSQRIVFLANQVQISRPEARADMLAALSAAVSEFERGYDRLLAMSGAEDPATPGRDHAIFEEVLFEQPYHLDHFTAELAARAHRFVSASEHENGLDVVAAGYSSNFELSHLDATVANEGGAQVGEHRPAVFAGDAQGSVMFIVTHWMVWLSLPDRQSGRSVGAAADGARSGN